MHNIAAKTSRKSQKYKNFTGFVESFLLQITHQKLKFEPCNMFKFNKDLLVEIVGFALSYDAVFIQFYLL